LKASKLRSLLFGGCSDLGQYASVAVRVMIAAVWFNSDIPRWVALVAGHPESSFFGILRSTSRIALPLTYFFTFFEAVTAIAYVLGLLTRLASLWSFADFAVRTAIGGLTRQVPLVDFVLWAGALWLLLNGSLVWSIDGWLAKRKGGIMRICAYRVPSLCTSST